MKNKEILRELSELQKHYPNTLLNNVEFYKNKLGFVEVSNGYICVTVEKFCEFEKEGLLEHISKKLVVFESQTEKKRNYWECEAMTPDGVRIAAH